MIHHQGHLEKQDLKESNFPSLPSAAFLSDGRHIISKNRNILTYFNLLDSTEEPKEVVTNSGIGDMTMKWPYVGIIHQDSFSIVDFRNNSIQSRSQRPETLVKIISNDFIVATVTHVCEVLIYKWPGKNNVLMKSCSSHFSRPDEPTNYDLWPNI